MNHSSQGVIQDQKGEDQPIDKERAQTVHRSDPRKSASHEATRDPKLNDAEKTPGAGTMPDDRGDPPTG
jgi:hypothetical protein